MVSSLVKRGISAFVSKQTSIFTAAFFIIITTIFSQILGLLKYRLIVSIFGASPEVGVFFAAFRIPDFIFQVLVAGALSSTFIPLFSDYVRHDKKKEAYRFTSSLVNIGILFFILVSAVIIVFAYQLCSLIAPGFSKQELTLMANLMIIIQLSQVFFILGTLITAILQSFQHFLIPGIATAFYNFGIILGIIIFSSFLGFGIYGAAVGVLIGAVLFFLVQLPLLTTTGFSYSPLIHISSSMKQMTRLMVPRSLTIIVTQLAITANVFFASFISARGLVVLDLAQTLIMAPVLLFGQSIAQASFPALALKADNKKDFISIFVTSFNQIIYLTIPISALLIVLRIPIVRLFYGASRFDWDATVDTGLTLAYFAFAITAQSLIFLLARAFFAQKDARTPFIVTVISVSVGIVISYVSVLVYQLPVFSLAASFSLSSIISIILLTILLDRKIGLPKIDMIITMGKILIAGVVMGVVVYVPIKLLDQLVFDTTRTFNLFILTSFASALGIGSYIFLTWLLDIKEAFYVIQVIKKFGSRRAILKQVSEVISGSSHNP